MPKGADTVVMVEDTQCSGEHIKTQRSLASGTNFSPRGCEAVWGSPVMHKGSRIGFSHIALLAMTGKRSVNVFRQPSVAILSTGDELVDVSETPLPYQIRNSNAYSIAAQVRRAGGIPEIFPIVRDNYDATWNAVQRASGFDLMLFSGGVSVGKYDLVEKVLADCGMNIFFDRVLIQPGKPVVFGTLAGKRLFGLPGNPVSTMVTFEIFARAALELLGGMAEAPLPLLRARLTREFRHKPGLTRFLPACLSPDGASVTPAAWTGSGDIAAVARSNAFLVAEPDRETWAEGEDIRVLMK